MKHTRFSCLLLIVSPWLLSDAVAEDLLDAYQAAQQHSLETGIQTAHYHAAQASSAQAKAGMKPSVKLSANASLNNQLLLDGDRPADSDNIFNHADAEYSLRWSKPLFNQSDSGAIATADAQTQEAQISLENQQQSLLLTVAQRYFEALKIQAKLTANQQEQTQLTQQRDATHKSYESGTVSQVDLAEIEAQYAQNLAEILQIEAQLLTAKEALALLTQRDYTVLATPVSGWLPDIIPVDRSVGEKLTQTKHPEVNLRRQSLEVAKQKVKQVYTNASSELDLVAEHSGHAVLGERFTQHNQFDNSIGAEFTLNFDTNNMVLLESQRQHQQQIAAELELVQAQQTSLQHTRSLYTRLDNGLKHMQLQQKAIKASEQSVELTHKGFVAGVRTADDYFQAIKRLSKAKLDYDYAVYDYWLDSLQLKANTGMLAEQDLKQLSQHMH